MVRVPGSAAGPGGVYAARLRERRAVPSTCRTRTDSQGAGKQGPQEAEAAAVGAGAAGGGAAKGGAGGAGAGGGGEGGGGEGGGGEGRGGGGGRLPRAHTLVQ